MAIERAQPEGIHGMRRGIAVVLATAGAAGAQSMVTLEGPGESRAVVTGDVTGDGLVDVVSIEATPEGEVMVVTHAGDGAGGFASPSSSSVASLIEPDGVIGDAALGDVDGDGDLDIAMSGQFEGGIENMQFIYALNDGGGGFAFELAILFGIGDPLSRVEAADVDGDGRDELLAGFPGAIINVNADGGFGGGGFFNGDVLPENSIVATGDLDADGDLDALHDSISYLGDGTGGFAPVGEFPGATASDCVIADLNADGFGDRVCTIDGAPDLVAVALGKGDGTFEDQTTLPGSFSPQDVVVQDVTGDGHVDIAFAHSLGESMSLMRGLGDGTFEARERIGTGGTPVDIASGRLDSDSVADLAVSIEGGGVRVLLSGCGADVNADGSLDVLDFIAFQTLWQAQDVGADCDGSGGFDVLDFVCFQGVFADGCP